jgi:hypothetical protein
LSAFGISNFPPLLSADVVLVITALAPTGWGTGPEGACWAAFGSVCIFPDWTDSGLFTLAMVLGSALAVVLEGLSALAVVLEDEEEVQSLSLSLCLFFARVVLMGSRKELIIVLAYLF